MVLKDLAITFLGKYFPKLYIKFKIKDKIIASQTIKGYTLIRENNLFDDDFYLKKYPKLRNIDLDLLVHYIFFGFAEGKNPNLLFDGGFYKNHYSDAFESDLNPLVHYVLYGLDENRLISPVNVDLEDYKTFKKNILYILHEKIGTIGGASFSILDIIRNLNDDFYPFILTSKDGEVELWDFNNSFEKIAKWSIEDTRDLNVIYKEILLKLDIVIVHINHLINHSFDLIDMLKKLNIPYFINIHDFYYICPSIHLIDENYNYCSLNCNEQCTSHKLKNINNKMDFIKSWREKSFNILNSACKIIAPSKSTINIYKTIYKDLDNYKLIEHGMDIIKTENNYYSIPNDKIKIVLPGHISPHKGSLLIQKIKELDKNNILEFHFIGTQIPNLKKYGITHGRYQREEFNTKISKIKPSYIAILSTCPETYSYTLTESLAAGIPVIATNLGALKERILNTNAGWLIDYKNPIDFYTLILNISKEEYLEKITNILHINFKSTQEMVDEYNSLYKEYSN